MYHRVSIPDTNPWGVCVSPLHFEEQIAWISRQYNVITPEALSANLRCGQLSEEDILVTFDDGYEDNFTTAKPILEKYNCPATFFIPTFYIGAGKSFWWDELEWIFLHGNVLPEELQLVINSNAHVIRVPPGPISKDQFRQHCRWRWYLPAPTERCSAFLAIWELLRPLPQQEIEGQMTIIREWSGLRTPRSGLRLPMNKPQLEELAAGTLFTLAAHTHTHPDLAAQLPAAQKKEMSDSNLLLREQYGIDNGYFAYPYGRFNEATTSLTKELGFDLCFTTSQSDITPDTSRFELGRFQAQDTGLVDFRALLR